MRATTTISPLRLDAALALLRAAVGAVFVAHGAQKLFVFGFAGVTGAFTQIGVPLPGIAGPAVALLEFGGGLALIFGLLTRLASIGLAINMLGAILLVHIANGFFNPTGIEFPLTLLAVALALVFTGAGRWSLDAMIAARRGTATSAPSALRQAA